MTQSMTSKDTKLLSIPPSIPDNGISQLRKSGQKEDTRRNNIVITSIPGNSNHLFFISLQGLYDKKKPFYGIYDKEKHITYMNDATVGLTDDLTHFMPFLSHHLYRRRRVCHFIGDRENRRMDG